MWHNEFQWLLLKRLLFSGSDAMSQITPSHVNVLLCHYGGQLKAAVKQKAGKKIDCKRYNKVKNNNKKKNWKMQSFCAVFNCSHHANREKYKSNYCFPSIVKNKGKEGASNLQK